MKRLNNLRTYLIGPIQYDKTGSLWRENIEKFLLPLGVQVINPLNKPIEDGRETPDIQKKLVKFTENGQFDELASYRHYRLTDLRAVDVSDFLVCHLDLNIPTCGSYEEIFISNRQKKPILIHYEQGKQFCPIWLIWAIPHQYIFSTWEELQNYLLDVNSNPNFQDLFKRWRFFQYS